MTLDNRAVIASLSNYRRRLLRSERRARRWAAVRRWSWVLGVFAAGLLGYALVFAMAFPVETARAVHNIVTAWLAR